MSDRLRGDAPPLVCTGLAQPLPPPPPRASAPACSDRRLEQHPWRHNAPPPRHGAARTSRTAASTVTSRHRDDQGCCRAALWRPRGGIGQGLRPGMRLPPCPARRTHATAAMLSRLYTSVASGPAAALERRGSPRAGARRRASGKRPRDARAATRRDAAPCSVPPCAEMQCRVISGHPRAYQSSAAVFATAVVRGAVRSALWDRAAALGASPHCWSTAAMLAWREASPGVRAAARVSTAAASTFKPVCCSEAASCRWRSEELPCPPPRGLSSQSRSSVACATPE